MCLGIPMRLLEVTDEVAKAESDGVVRTVDVSLIENPAPGDYVIVHAGFAIERIDPVEAETRLAWFEELARQTATGPGGIGSSIGGTAE